MNLMMHKDIGHWQYTDDVPLDTFGFVYCIENLKNRKKYIGKKQMFKIIKRKPLKGKKNKRHEKIESDWKTYTSSCNELNEDIKREGIENFRFEILRLCDSKWELAYYEAKEQFDKNVLLDESYYNGIINLRVARKG